MGHTFKRAAPALVTQTGLAPTAQMKYVPWTAAHMVFAWEAPVGVRKAGPAQRAIRELATRVVPSTGPARTASVNAAKDGTGSTARLRAAPACATAMGDVHWTKMAGIVFASQAGEEQAVM